MILDDACRIRVIRALLNWESREMASKLGVSTSTMTSWEKGRSTPQRGNRVMLAELCHKSGICFLSSGMPVPASDLLPAGEMK